MRCIRCDAELSKSTLGGLCAICLLDPALPDGASESENQFHYDLIEEIGRGGMGLVYSAIQHGSQRQVAVKMMLVEQSAAPGMMERFRAEAEAVAALDHPNILPIYETGEYEGRPFYSMKFARGGSLRERLTDFRYRPRDAAQFVATIARAIHHAHQRGILHRDLKPGNILIDGPEFTPYVTDFGLAKWLGRDRALTVFPTALGTPQYMAPEQAAGASIELTTAADTYSLGVILYEILAGRPPFVADTPLEILRLAKETPPPRLRELAPDVPRDLEIICLKCLAKEPGSRYGSTAALADDIERSLEGLTILARPATRVERTWRWAKRNPALAGLSIALFTALIAVAVGSSVAAGRLRISNQRAVAAEHQAREELRAAALAQARATRLTGRMGQRFDTLNALKKAAAVRPGADLRTEALAALMLPDLKVERTWDDRHASNSPAAFDSTLSRYVVESDAGILSLRRTADQSEIARFLSPDGYSRVVYIAPFSADDSVIAARYASNAIRVFDVATGKGLGGLDGMAICSNGRTFDYDFVLTPDGKELAVGTPEGGVLFYDFRVARRVSQLLTPTVPAIIAISPDGQKIAIVGKKSPNIEIYDRASSRLEHTLVHPSHVYHVAWRPGVLNELAASCNDDNLYLWDAAQGLQLRVLKGHEGIPPQIAFHPNGKILASTSRDFSIRLWDVESGVCLLNAHGVYGEPCLRFSSDGHNLAIGSESTRLSIGTILLDSPCREFYHCDLSDWYSRVNGMTVSRDGGLLAISLRSNGFHIFSTKTMEVVADLLMWPGSSKTACFTPSSDTLVYSGDGAGLWQRSLKWDDAGKLEAGAPKLINSRPGFLVTDVKGDPLMAALYSEPFGKFSVVSSADPFEPIDLPVKSRPAGAFLTPDLRFVVTNDWEGPVKGESDVRVWDAKTGNLIRRLGSGPNNSVRISPNGKYLLACGNGPGAGLWSLPGLARGPKLQTAGDDGWFMPDEKLIGILNNDSLDLVRIADGSLIGSFPGDSALCVVFAPNGLQMYTGYGTHFYEWNLVALRRELRANDLDWEE